MKKMIIRVATAGALVGSGWAAGTAQTGRGDFEVRINAVVGTTSVECLRGCTLIGSRDVRNPVAGRSRTYEFSCTSRGGRCEAVVVGFVQR